MAVVSEVKTAVPEAVLSDRPFTTVQSVHGMLAAACSLMVLGAIAFAIDLPVSQWMHTHQGLKALHQPLQVVEGIGDSTGVILILVTLYLTSRSRRRELLRMVCTVFAAGLLADVVKFCIARTRPRSFPGTGLLDLHSVTETFHGWFPFWSSGSVFINSKYQSFPSAHTATGAALAVALTRLYPQAGWWFGVLAAAVALQRVETGAHYLSDTCFGGAVGILAAMTFQQGTRWSKWFDRFEMR
jgi:membrane-associated phospholipid phosphatase